MKYSDEIVDALADGLDDFIFADASALRGAVYRLYDLYPKKWRDITRLRQGLDQEVPQQLMAEPRHLERVDAAASGLAMNCGMDMGDAQEVTRAWAEVISRHIAPPLANATIAANGQAPSHSINSRPFRVKTLVGLVGAAFVAGFGLAAVSESFRQTQSSRAERLAATLTGYAALSDESQAATSGLIAVPAPDFSSKNLERIQASALAATEPVAHAANASPIFQVTAEEIRGSTRRESANGRPIFRGEGALPWRAGSDGDSQINPAKSSIGSEGTPRDERPYFPPPMASLPQERSYASGAVAEGIDDVRNVLVFHMPWTGNDPLRREVIGASVETGKVFRVQINGSECSALRVVRRLSLPTGKKFRYWLAVITDECGSEHADLRPLRN